MIGCSAIFICAAIFVFITYVKPKLNQQYVANKEFTDTNTDTDNYADLYFFYTSGVHTVKAQNLPGNN